MDVPLELSAYTRVLRLASTPSWEEFSQIAKIAGAGILLIGAIGFVVFLIMGGIVSVI
ncbi:MULTISPECIES: protein translocase SEC61 complex subunit gamma [Halobacterium]|uniref:protein translocase SEC61 complex subunit gamma n=1 Tax=Halobacterium TaxID=2239 RepID=UPI0019653950|nr:MULTISPECIES: protein translocase SEC61 complex subunit gamma [Halobacterium]MCF2164140.1 protein translocase SEC61 complex subunit gamma [Halobacterium salinarum]MCF2167784.1 protein translocase SEC61 complex subunit gamma [Halobacterium salinarum]MCF2206845.1 protein translocase SEC61 complex subunit gamma [Halobacterium salinarum]MCF2238986.1 protein translocase SEC61 complex subunit gamma [Halobacterium salinarum]MCF2240627.1 protein translocase SEC61 complex subunit gamma [Halobacteriu